MDRRWLPFAVPRTGKEEEETIALLSYVANDLLVEHHRTVEVVRRKAEHLSTVALVIALLAFGLLLAQDTTLFPTRAHAVLAVVTLLALLLGILLRSRFVDARRFEPPAIVRIRKLSWQWLAVPVDESRMVLWDTLTDESVAVDLPPELPRRPDWLLRPVEPFESLEEEKALIARLGDMRETWQAPSETARLPKIGHHQSELLSVLGALPRGRHWEPTRPLPPARSLEVGQMDLQRLLKLHETHRLLLHQLDAWEEAVPAFSEALQHALLATIPSMDPPPAPPTAHPSGDVTALDGTLELVRSTAIEGLRAALQDELVKQKEELAERLRVLEKDWERERNTVHYGSDTLINSLKRQVDDLEQRVIPEAEQALKESQVRLREASDRAMACETELAEKRKQLLLASTGDSDSPRASDERKRELNSAVERLAGTLPEIKRSAATWEEVVASQRAALERAQGQLDRLRQEYHECATQRDGELERIDHAYKAAREECEEQAKPLMEAIEADLRFFDLFMDRFNEALHPFRVDLIMEDEAARPYTQVVQQTYQIVEKKAEAVQQWSAEVVQLIQRRREAVRQLVAAIEANALPNVGLRQPRLMLLPVWYVEARGGRASLWPWRRREPREIVRLIGPMVEARHGQRLALPDGEPLFFAPIPAFQERLDALLQSERRADICEGARRLGCTVLFDTNLLNAVAIPAQMPRAMVDLLRPFSHPVPNRPVREEELNTALPAVAVSVTNEVGVQPRFPSASSMSNGDNGGSSSDLSLPAAPQWLDGFRKLIQGEADDAVEEEPSQG